VKYQRFRECVGVHKTEDGSDCVQGCSLGSLKKDDKNRERTMRGMCLLFLQLFHILKCKKKCSKKECYKKPLKRVIVTPKET
jgi:hypothetical protein